MTDSTCTQCKNGTYLPFATPGHPEDVSRLGWTPSSGIAWKILRCSNCRHVLMFALDPLDEGLPWPQ